MKDRLRSIPNSCGIFHHRKATKLLNVGVQNHERKKKTHNFLTIYVSRYSTLMLNAFKTALDSLHTQYQRKKIKMHRCVITHYETSHNET